jgi:acyl-CoA thioesterase FadM
MFLRTVIQMWRSRRASRLGMLEVSSIRRRVVPTDIDVLGHMNNGIYLSYMDLGRMDLFIRTGAWAEMLKRGWRPVAASETMSFRRSLQPFQSFELQTRLIGLDDKAMLFEQRFVVDGEIFAQGVVRGRFVKKAGGTVSMTELAAAFGLDRSALTPPEWVSAWADAAAMPPARASFVSDWR